VPGIIQVMRQPCMGTSVVFFIVTETLKPVGHMPLIV
jgi:hypothetical protein